MRVLVVGGNRFLGIELTFRLLANGHHVTLLNRGNMADPFGPHVERLRCDRGAEGFDATLAGRTFDAAVDFALFDEAQARRTARVLEPRVGQYVMISTGQVYLVRDGYPVPTPEEAYPGPLMPAPDGEQDQEAWRYGVDKRAAEDVIAQSRLRSVRFRLPMVHGTRDYHRRIESVLWRVLDRGPIFVARDTAPVRHVYSVAVVRAVLRALEAPPPAGAAYNLAMTSQLSVRGLVEAIAACLSAMPRVVPVSRARLQQYGLDPVAACPFSGEWMSCLDPSKAMRELAFTHEDLAAWLPGVVETLLSRWPHDPPPSMKQRGNELEHAEELRR